MGVKHNNSSAARAGRAAPKGGPMPTNKRGRPVSLRDGRSGIERDRAGRWALVELPGGKMIKVDSRHVED